MARSTTGFVAPSWLRCCACVAGLIPLFVALVAAIFNPTTAMTMCVFASGPLFRYCLHTLIIGTPPRTTSECIVELWRGRFATRESRDLASAVSAEARARGAP